MRAVLSMIVLAVVACQPASPPAPSAISPADAGAGADASVKTQDTPPPAPELPPHIWGISDYGSLMYAPFPSDDIHIAISCLSRGRVEIVAVNTNHGGRLLRLASGPVSEDFAAEAIPGDGELHEVETTSSRIEIGIDNPVLVAFRASGVLSKNDPPEEMKLYGQNELATIEQFFSDCESRQP